MSIEEKLRMEYKRKSRALSVPKEPAAKVVAAFRDMSQDSKSGRHHNGSEKSAHRRTAFWLAAILLLSGFAYGGGKLLFQNQLGLWSLQLFSGGEDMLLDEAASEEIWSSLQDVKRELQPGEAAMVYFAALAESTHPLYRNYPLFGVKNSLWLQESHAQVVNRMRKDGLQVLVPETLPDGYVFSDAFQGEPLSVNAGPEGLLIMEQLQDEIAVSGKRVAWARMKKYEPASNLYTLAYVHEQGDTLLVTVEALEEQRVDQRWVVPNSTQVEELNIRGNKASYTSGDDVPFSATRYYQEVSWSIIDPSHANGQYIYRVGSESKKMGKAELLRLAESFMYPHVELRLAA
ncbi:hypothetical protein D3P07_18810 [Paenibacillus sp. 1011MAR3C5]|uniref:hypothetical protein n=1 Tax=Paenibacillus sp. 1011MAR3C5 TaxID=1675787 RepID=UPI000E6C945B|nr:hypothetical protein [Paenibacillus sp. 1011MAR3C5]RJE86134.1 hypothetical protein D3P07_18810 [Paenibacillus sp. 1011MAR3C5]